MMLHRWMLAACLMFVGIAAAEAGDDREINEDYTLTLAAEDTEGPPGGSLDLEILLTNDSDDDLSGYQWGICTEAGFDVEEDDIVIGKDIEDLDTFFSALNVYEGEGWIVAVVFALDPVVLKPGEDIQMYTFKVGLPEEVPEESSEACEVPEEGANLEIYFCGTLNDPKTEVQLVTVEDVIYPVEENLCLLVNDQLPSFVFTLPDLQVDYDPKDGLASFVIEPTILEDAAISDDFPSETQAFAMGFSIDDSVLTVTDLSVTAALADFDGGSGPYFVGSNLQVAGGGVTVAVVYSFEDETLAFEVETAVLSIDVETVAAELVGDKVGLSTELTWSDSLGSPPVRNTVAVARTSMRATFISGSVDLVALLGTPFLRGDCNDDGSIGLVDGIGTLKWLFEDGPAGTCMGACDITGDGSRSLIDATYTFNYLFNDGPGPAKPFPDCGVVDPEEDCELYESCEDD